MIAKQDLQHQPPGDWVHRWGFQTVSAMALGLALACGGGGGGGGSTTPTVTEPTITSFTASPTTLTVGDTSSSLTAVFEHGTGAVDKGVDAVTSGVAKSITPDTTAPATITYTLTVTGEAGTTPKTQTTAVKVVAAATKPAEITIGSGLTQFTTGVAGYTASVAEQTGCTYAWTITGGTPATQSGRTATFTAGAIGDLVLSCVVTNEAGKSAEAISRTVPVVSAITITPVAINVLAMPTGAPAADVVVTGPSYTRTLTASGTLTDLAAGTYTVTANTVYHATLPALGLGLDPVGSPSPLLPADSKRAYYPLQPVQTFTMSALGTPSTATITVRYPEPTKDIVLNPSEPNPLNQVKMTFVLVPAGSFDMGSTDPYDSHWLDATSTTTPHRVTFTHAFYVAETPCTQAQWATVAQQTSGITENPSRFKAPLFVLPAGHDLERPVEQVSWYAVNETTAPGGDFPYPNYIEELKKIVTGYAFRLPSEAEYEYATRAGTTTGYFFGNSDSDLGDYAVWDRLDNNVDQTLNGTAPVKSKRPNQWGLYDIIGNVSQWCEDRSHGLHYDGFFLPANYPGAGSDGVGKGYDRYDDLITPANSYPAPPTDGSAWLSPYAPDIYNQRIQRGGWWYSGNGVGSRSAFRYDRPADNNQDRSGFRLVMAVPAP